MHNPLKPQTNRWIIIAQICIDAIYSAIASLRLMWSTVTTNKIVALKPNRFFGLIDFIARSGPKNFWKFPTGIRMGRSIATLLRYIFELDRSFSKK